MNNKAFTLIELIITIAMISILAAVAFVAVNPAKRIGDSKDDERLAEAISIKAAIEKYTTDNLVLPPSIESKENYIPYMVTSEEIEGLLSCPEVLGDIPTVNLSNELAAYLPSLPVDPDETNPEVNGTGYYLRKYNNIITEVKPCDLYNNEDIPSDGLVFAARMDEDPSSPIPEYSGNNNDGESHGDMTSDDSIIGKVGGAIDFDGDDDHINFGDINETEAINEISISFWFNFNDVMQEAEFITKGQYHAAGSSWSTDFDGSGPRFSVAVDGAYTHPDYTFKNNQWYHYFVVYSFLDAIIDVYIDGDLIGQGNFGGNPFDVIPNTDKAVKIGDGDDSAKILDGKMDEVAIWDRALLEEEVLAIYNLQK